jgi:hypothetical protein
MANIEIITSNPRYSIVPTALLPNLPAPSVGDKIETGIKKTIHSLSNSFTVTNIIDSVTLSKNLKDFLQNLQPVLDEATSLPGNFKINEIELNLAISAEGSIKLIGEFSAGFQTSITLKLSRASNG